MRRGLVASAHDASEGGLAVALAEMVLAGHLGLEVDLGEDEPVPALFSESLGRILLEVRAEHAEEVVAALEGEARVIGRVVPALHLHVTTTAGKSAWTGRELAEAWRGDAA
jgi:phosphoribosylformylglycinamidine synthase